MSVHEKNTLVPAASVAVAKQRRALVRRGLDDLSTWLRRKPRVLLVDDQRVLLEEMEHILATSGYEVRSTCSPADALPMANAFLERWRCGRSPKEFKAQFVMLGLAMPVTLGAELFASDLCISKIILWGEVPDSEDLEQRREFYDFETLLTQMTSWIAEAWTANGNLLDGKERHSEALECHDEALRLDPLCIAAWINKGLCLNELGRWPDALESYDSAIEIDASDWRPWVDKGYILDGMGRHEEALRCFDAALKLSADLISSWKGRGIALDHLGRYEDAIACYDEVFRIDRPSWTEYGRASAYSDAWNLKGVTFSHVRRFQDAIECYDRAISLDPKNANPWYNKGIALMKTSRPTKAIGCYDKALELWAGHAESWNNKGICLRELGRLEEALACHEKALGCHPPEVLGWYNKALIQEDLGRIQNAVSSYENYLAAATTYSDHEVEHARERLHILKSGRTERPT